MRGAFRCGGQGPKAGSPEDPESHVVMVRLMGKEDSGRSFLILQADGGTHHGGFLEEKIIFEKIPEKDGCLSQE